MCTPNCIHTLQATTVKCTNCMYMHILFRGAMFDSWGWLFWVLGVFWFPNSKVINEWVSQTAIRFIHWLRILGCIDEIGQLATCISIWSHHHSCFQPVILLTIPTTWPLSTGNSIQWQYKVVHHFQVRLPKSYMQGYTELFQICLCVLKVLTSLPPSPHPPPHSEQHRLTNALHMTAQNDAKEET